AAQGDETHTSAHGEWHTAQCQRGSATYRAQRNAGRDDEHISQRTETEVEQNEDQTQRERHDEKQTAIGALHVLELAAPFDGVTFRQFYLAHDAVLGFCNETSNIPAAHVALNCDAAATPF